MYLLKRWRSEQDHIDVLVCAEKKACETRVKGCVFKIN